MSEQKKPQPGEWWQCTQDDHRVRIAGFDEDGDPVFTCRCGEGAGCDIMENFLEDYRPLPGCTGWDWVEPVDQWPKYFKAYDEWNAYIVCHQNGDCFAVKKDGSETASLMKIEEYKARRSLTEAEAKARLTPSLSTCPDCGEFRGHGHDDVCPMAWVTQDRVPPRRGIDQWAWVPEDVDYGSPNESDWSEEDGNFLNDIHGMFHPGYRERLHVRCRRKDLPVPMTQQSVAEVCEPDHLPTRKPVRLFVDSETRQMTAFFGDGKDRVYKSAIDDCEVKYDGKNFFVEVQQ